MASIRREISICSGTPCASAGNMEIKDKIESEIKAMNLENVSVRIADCYGLCRHGPIIAIEPEGIFYSKIKLNDVTEIVHSHLQNNQPVERLLYKSLKSKPSASTQSGLWDQLTMIDHSKPLITIPADNDADIVAFALIGHVVNCGLVEVTRGTSLREVVYDIGGGIPNGKRLKAIQVGGPTGACLPISFLDEPIDFDGLTKADPVTNCNGMLIMNEDICMVDVLRYFLDIIRKESCGKCVPCRLGIVQMINILERISKGDGELSDIDLLQELYSTIRKSSLCELGKTSSDPIETTLRYFRDEFEAHINGKRCPALVCKALTRFEISPDKCRGCHLCAKNCPAGCITGNIKQPHVIDQDKCIKCGTCYKMCPVKDKAISRISGVAKSTNS